MLHYNTEQLNFITSLPSNKKLLGIPGGGKTASIIAHIQHHNLGKNKTLILTFSVKAKSDFILRNQHLLSQNNIRTIHSIAASIVKKFTTKTCKSVSTVVMTAVRILHSLTNKDELPLFYKSLQYIIVDEAQDISSVQHSFVVQLSTLLNIPVVLVGDPNQNIYQFQGGCDKFLMEHKGETHNLILNHRSTPEIVNFINHFRVWKDIAPMKTENANGNIKPILFHDTIQRCVDHLIEDILNSPNEMRKQIAIISPVKKCKPIGSTYANIGLQLIVNHLEQKQIPYVLHYNLNSSEEASSVDDTNTTQKEGCVNLYTIHTSKGLEYDTVYLLNFHHNTYGRIPSAKKYNEFKYLWYVGLSRAKRKLVIYADIEKHLVDTIYDVPRELFVYLSPKQDTLNRRPPYHKLILNQEQEQIFHQVVKTIQNMDEKMLFDLEHLVSFTLEETVLFELPTTPPTIDNYHALYGNFMESVYTYFYLKKLGNNGDLDYINSQTIQLKEIVYVSNQYKNQYNLIQKIYSKKIGSLYTLTEIYDVVDFVSYKEKPDYLEFLRYITYYFHDDFTEKHILLIENDVHSIEIINHICKVHCEMDTNDEPTHLRLLYLIQLFWFQIEFETGYLIQNHTAIPPPLWNLEYDDIFIKPLREYIFETEQPSELIFQYQAKHPNIPLIGRLDAINKEQSVIIDYKFVKSIGLQQALQLILYYILISPNSEKPIELFLWNFYEGKSYKVIYNQQQPNINMKIILLLCDHLGIKMKNTVFVYDFETTGLINEPFPNSHDAEFPHIIERHFYEPFLNYVPSTGIVSSLKHLSSEIKTITGITDEMVAIGDNIKVFVQEMIEIMKYCDKPIFVAHNGDRFDHRILCNICGFITKENATFLDSMRLFNMFNIGEKTENSRLETIYKSVVNNDIVQSHRAEGDVKMIIDIMNKLNLTLKSFADLTFN